MSKYSEEFKLKIVKEYLEGPLGYGLLAKKYGVASPTVIRNWIKAYQVFGRKGVKKKQKHTTYSVQLKLDVLHFMKQTGASYSETALAFGINNPPLIASWKKIVQLEGNEGLQPKPKGRPSMKKNKKNFTTLSTPSVSASKERTLKELERENELLRLENSYLKKLEAFRENPTEFLEEHKQQLLTDLKKKDLN